MRLHARCPLPAIKEQTVRKWCSTHGPFKLGEQVDRAYRQGLADQALGETDASRLLPRV
jgi:hypothetical protein